MLSEAKKRLIENAIQQIEKQYGQGSLMCMGSLGKSLIPEGLKIMSTGCMSVDIALGVGGLPKGRIIELFGPESSGKTTLTLQIIATAQKQGNIAAFIDAEHALDIKYARNLGVNVDELLVSQPDTAEQALEIVDTLIKSGAVDLIVVDSVAALVPKAEIEGEMGDVHMGLQARLMSQALRKLAGNLNKHNCTVIFINQIRMKIGVTFGNPETTTGGTALKFFSSVRMEIRKTTPVKDGNEQIGTRTRVKVVKNKVAPPFKEAEFDILYGKGICIIGDLLDLSVEQKLLQKNGSWYYHKEERLGQGRDQAKESLLKNPELMENLFRQLRGSIFNSNVDSNFNPTIYTALASSELASSNAQA